MTMIMAGIDHFVAGVVCGFGLGVTVLSLSLPRPAKQRGEESQRDKGILDAETRIKLHRPERGAGFVPDTRPDRQAAGLRPGK